MINVWIVVYAGLVRLGLGIGPMTEKAGIRPGT